MIAVVQTAENKCWQKPNIFLTGRKIVSRCLTQTGVYAEIYYFFATQGILERCNTEF